jgi:hypothetical protein
MKLEARIMISFTILRLTNVNYTFKLIISKFGGQFELFPLPKLVYLHTLPLFKMLSSTRQLSK